MTLSLEGLLLFAIFVLPGVVARAEAERVSPIPPDQGKTAIREVADGLAHSVALFPPAAAVAVCVLWLATGGSFGILDLLHTGLGGVFQQTPGAALLALAAYVIAGLISAEIVGATRLLARLRARLLDLLPGSLGLTDDPIWYEVLENRRKVSKHTETYVNVYLDDDTRYTGILLHFPILPDDSGDRDFAIWKARHYIQESSPIELDSAEVVLLNTRHCRAVEVKYVTPVEVAPDLLVVPEGGAPPTSKQGDK